MYAAPWFAPQLARLVAFYQAIPRPSEFPTPSLPLPPTQNMRVRYVPKGTPRDPATGRYPASSWITRDGLLAQANYCTVIYLDHRFEDRAQRDLYVRRATAAAGWADECLRVARSLKSPFTQMKWKYKIYNPDTYIDVPDGGDPGPWGGNSWSGVPDDGCVCVGDIYTLNGTIWHELGGHAALAAGETDAQWIFWFVNAYLQRPIQEQGILSWGYGYGYGNMDDQFRNSGLRNDPYNDYGRYNFWVYASLLYGIEGAAAILDGPQASFQRETDPLEGRGRVTGGVGHLESLAVAAGVTPAEMLQQYVRDVVTLRAFPRDSREFSELFSRGGWKWFARGDLAGQTWTPTARFEYNGYLVVDCARWAGRRLTWELRPAAALFRVSAFSGTSTVGPADADVTTVGSWVVPSTPVAWLAFSAVELPEARSMRDIALTRRPRDPPGFTLRVG